MASNNDIPMGYNNSLVQQALQAGDAGIDAQRQAGMNTIGAAEQSMYDMLGRMQLQNERNIADQRIKALRSGQTSSQLAAMEMQNLQTSQIGATQIMQDARNQRLALEQEYAGKKDMNRYYMLEMLNQNVKDSAAIDAQKYSASGIMQAQEVLGEGADALSVLAYMKSMQGAELSPEEQTALDNAMRNNSSGLINEYAEKYGLDPNDGAVKKLFESDKPMTFGDFENMTNNKGSFYDAFSTGIFNKDIKNAYNEYILKFNELKGTSFEARNALGIGTTKGYKK